MNKSKIDWEYAENMRAKGESYSQIGRLLAVPRQTVFAHFAKKGERSRIKTPYVGILEWAFENHLSKRRICYMMFGTTEPTYYNKAIRLLNGKQKVWEISVIKRLTIAAGKSFEELFSMEEPN